MNEVTGVVLAGGGSTRFKDEYKPVTDFKGKPLVEHVAEAVDETFTTSPVLVVKYEHQKTAIENVLSTDVRFVYDDPEFEGPLAGLFGALGSTYRDWLFVCGADMPYVTPESIRGIGSEKSRNDGAVVPVDDDGTPQTLHAVYHRKPLGSVSDVLDPDDGLRALVDALPNVREVDGERIERATTSVDTKDALLEEEKRNSGVP